MVGFTKKYPCGTRNFKDITGVFSSVFLYRGILIAGFYCTEFSPHDYLYCATALPLFKSTGKKARRLRNLAVLGNLRPFNYTDFGEITKV